MKFISVSDMRFKDRLRLRLRLRKRFNILFALSFIFFVFTSTTCFSEVIDRVVAYVDENAITMSEYAERYEKMKKAVGGITEREVIESMINRALIVKEAKKIRLEAGSIDDVVSEYIDIKIKALIIIKEEDIGKFYSANLQNFGGKEYSAVRDDIEKYLFELETNQRLRKHLEELRQSAEIKIMPTYK